MDGRPPRRLRPALGVDLTTLGEVADALYAGDPSAFIAARDEAAKAARASGDRALSAAIKQLRRPSLAAWYVNLAARSSLVSLREWLALGAALREAQGALDMARVRELGAGRGVLENRVVRDLSAHLQALGVTVSLPALDEVRSTLRAALADAGAADAVAAGRLDRALTYGGFGEVDLSAALATLAARDAPAPGAEPERPGPEPDAEVAAPEPVVEEAAPRPDPELVAALGAATRRLADAERVRDDAEETVARAEAALAVAQRGLREARAALGAAESDADAAARAVASARDALDDAATS